MSSSQPQPLSISKGVAMLTYGLPGAGKTRLIGSSSKPVLIVRPSSDHTDSIGDKPNVEEMVIDDWSGMFELYQWGQQGGFQQYEWVWWDSISLAQDHLLEDVLEDAIARKPARAIDKGGVRVPEYGPDKGEYKINMEREAKWIRDMLTLCKAGMFNLGITAHPIEWWDPSVQEDLWAPWIQGKNMIPKVCGYMNVIAYLQEQRSKEEGEEPKRVLTVDTPGFMGKDQFQIFPALKSGKHGLIDPSLDDVDKAIRKARGSVGSTPAATKRSNKRPAAKKRPARRSK